MYNLFKEIARGLVDKNVAFLNNSNLSRILLPLKFHSSEDNKYFEQVVSIAIEQSSGEFAGIFGKETYLEGHVSIPLIVYSTSIGTPSSLKVFSENCTTLSADVQLIIQQSLEKFNDYQLNHRFDSRNPSSELSAGEQYEERNIDDL